MITAPAPLEPTAALAQGPPAARLAKGKFLVASKDLRDPNFARSVVLLLEYGAGEGALGLVVNRPTTMKLTDLLPDVEGLDPQATAYFGGPVLPSGMLVLLRSAETQELAKRVVGEVSYSSSRELLMRLAEDGEAAFRVFAGHSGWAPGQLEWEMKRGSWHVLRADAEAVFDSDPEKLWDELIRRSSGLWV